MFPELRHRVQASVGNLRPVQPRDGLFDSKLAEYGVDHGVQRLAVGYPLHVAREARIGRDFRPFKHDRAELRPLALILDAEVDLLAIASTEGAIGRDGRMTRPGAWRRGTTIGREVRRRAHPLAQRLKEREFKRRSLSRPFALIERRENPREGIHASRDVRSRDANL